eukprot:1211557-Pleurochrysis_carterae.AAC.1
MLWGNLWYGLSIIDLSSVGGTQLGHRQMTLTLSAERMRHLPDVTADAPASLGTKKLGVTAVMSSTC